MFERAKPRLAVVRQSAQPYASAPPRKTLRQDVSGRDLLGNGKLGILLTESGLRHVHQFVQ